MKHPDSGQILSLLQQFLAEKFDIPSEKAGIETPLLDLGLDSMLILDVLLEVEDQLGVKLDDLAIPRNATLGDVVNVIQRNLEKAE
ncbi:MAG TPA: acyl carrier protein [Dokdonella sp.]|uniref:acyl carrier protein n=1 Tax=Dokdonella sp. TaxID=2291710 RepID=UPI002D7E48B9|nr:acyl carrier protein [Dokdonella sp.]HET9032757.1 acyl carrier protein [Dokdonella sp.]